MADGSLVEPPQLVGFGKALEFIRSVHRDDQPTLVAIDQPTIVLNTSGMRPVDKVAASVVSWIGGGVQPANRAKIGMFSDNPPIWRFLQCLHAAENPELAREAKTGLFLMEVKGFAAKGLGHATIPVAERLFVLKIDAPSSRP
jgi:predicted RNase H-like nuclease